MNVPVREFYHQTSKVTKQAEQGPVTILRGGEPAFVLMRYDAYARLTGKEPTVGDLLVDPNATGDFDPPRYRSTPRPAEFD